MLKKSEEFDCNEVGRGHEMWLALDQEVKRISVDLTFNYFELVGGN